MKAETDAGPANKRLQSWKEIAAFFNRDERTIRRWETQRGLPVHRVPGGTRGAIYAYTAELDVWLKQPDAADETEGASAELSRPEPETPAAGVIQGTWRYKRLVTAAISLAVLVPAVLVAWQPWRAAHASYAPAPSVAASTHLPNPNAVTLYRTGLYYWNARTPASLNLAVDSFTQAIVQDPDYAEAYVGLANCYNLLREFSMMPPEEAYPRAEAAAERAIALKPQMADAHTSLAFVEFYWRRDVAAAEREFRRALALNPGSALTHHWYATVLMTMGKFAQAQSEIDKARSLDPTSSAVLADRALILFYGGREQEAIDALKGIEQTTPEFYSSHAYLSWIYLMRGDNSDYLDEAAKAAELKQDTNRQAIVEAGKRGWAQGGHARMLESMLASERRLYEQNQFPAWELAETAAGLGDKSQAIAYLKVSLARHETDNLNIGVSRSFASLRNDAAFRVLAQRALPLPR